MQAETIQAVKRSYEALEACRLACRWLQPVSRDKTCIFSKESLAQIVNGGSLRCGTARGCKVGSIEHFPRKAEALCLVLQTAEPGFLYGCKFEDFWASQRSRRAFSPVRGPNTSSYTPQQPGCNQPSRLQRPQCCEARPLARRPNLVGADCGVSFDGSNLSRTTRRTAFLQGFS